MTIGSTSAVAASSSLAVLQQDPNATREQQLRDAATAFESIFLQQVFSEMRKTGQLLGGSKDMGGQFYESMLDQAVAESAAANDGFGIRDVLLRSWGLEPETTSQQAARRYNDQNQPTPIDSASVTESQVRSGAESRSSGGASSTAVAAADMRLDRALPNPRSSRPSDMALALPASTAEGFARWQAPVSEAATQPNGYDATRELRGTRLFTTPDATVHASAGGRVTGVFYEAVHGPSVEIEHEDGWVTRYGGLDDVSVAVGDHVDAGAALGQVAGANENPYLHFEVRRGNAQFNPRVVVPALQVSDE